MTKHFRAGEKVRAIETSNGNHITKGREYTVIVGTDKDGLIQFYNDNGDLGGAFAQRFELVPAKVSYVDELGGPFSGPYRTREITKTWIIAVLDKAGKPRPSTAPRVYTSEAQAEAVAKKMAEENAGETFMVFSSTAVAAVPAVRKVELVRL